MTRMIEKIAAAIEKADEAGTLPIEGPEWSLELARAAVEAMMEPNGTCGAFRQAGIIGPRDDPDPVKEVWQSMLRAILDEEE